MVLFDTLCVCIPKPHFSQWQANNWKRTITYFIFILALHPVLALRNILGKWFGSLFFASFRAFPLISLMSLQ